MSASGQETFRPIAGLASCCSVGEAILFSGPHRGGGEHARPPSEATIAPSSCSSSPAAGGGPAVPRRGSDRDEVAGHAAVSSLVDRDDAVAIPRGGLELLIGERRERPDAPDQVVVAIQRIADDADVVGALAPAQDRFAVAGMAFEPRLRRGGAVAFPTRARDRSIVEELALNADVLEAGAVRVKRQPQGSERFRRIGAASEACVLPDEGSDPMAARTENELRRPDGRRVAARVERLEALVVVVVAVKHQIDPACRLQLPDGGDPIGGGAFRADGERRVVVEDECARRQMAVEVVLQPLVLCRSLLVDVAEVEEEVRLPAADQLGDIGRFLLATGAVTGCGDDEGSSGGGGGPAGRGERRRCRLLAAVAERDGERAGLRAGSVAQERDRAQRVTPVCEQITGKL